MTPGLPADLRELVWRRVGGFFWNTRRVSTENCSICTVPSASSLCSKCRDARAEFGHRIADLVVPLTYVKANAAGARHQSEYEMYAYKQHPLPVEKCAQDLSLMVYAATSLHGECIAAAAGEPWQALTFVPSATRPGPEHPVAELARHVVNVDRSTRRIVLGLGPGIGDSSRTVRYDKYVVPEAHRAAILNRHVLVVEDTWTTGSKSQSAAVALKDAGARTVTILCVARWTRYDWADHRAYLDQLAGSYDAYRCPVQKPDCRFGSLPNDAFR